MKNNIKKYGDCDSKLKYWWQIIKPLLWYLLISILFGMFVGAIAIIANINSGFELVEAAGVTPAYDSSIINFLIDN